MIGQIRNPPVPLGISWGRPHAGILERGSASSCTQLLDATLFSRAGSRACPSPRCGHRRRSKRSQPGSVRSCTGAISPRASDTEGTARHGCRASQAWACVEVAVSQSLTGFGEGADPWGRGAQ
jgi:hypothetical protein